MIPIDKEWYQKLLAASLLMGLVGAIGALIYDAVTNAGIDFFFGDAGTDWWTGQWWWIPLTAIGGLLVAFIRRWRQIPKDVPGGVETVGNGWVEPRLGIELVAISAISVILGASLGPSFAFILMGGAFGAFIVKNLKFKREEIRQEYSLTGMAGALGGAFSAPLFTAVLISEASPTKKKYYVRTFVPQLIAGTIGFMIFFGITGSSLLGEFALPAYEYDPSQIPTAALLGVIATFILIGFILITKYVNQVFSRFDNSLMKGLVGGTIVGLIIFALPLSAGSGVAQLNEVLATPESWSVAFLVAVLVAKMLALSISLASGFLGGNVFPMVFIGGVSGVIIHLLFPEIPLTLAVAAMLVAVPGAVLKLPLTLTILVAGTVGLTATATIPVVVAYVIAQLTMTTIQKLIENKRQEPSAA